MAASLLLDVVAWDLCLDARGNWALAADPYAVVQNVATACRLVQGEAYYDTTRGVPYFPDIFGGPYAPQLIKSDMEAMAGMVAGVEEATCYLSALTDRSLSGQVQVQTAYGPLTASV